MFKRALLALVLAGLACATPVILAQNGGASEAPASSARAEGPRRARLDPQQRSQMLAKKLNLSADQQSKVQDILQSARSDMEKVHSDSSLAPADRRAKMMDIHKSADGQIRSLLNPDQQKKWDAMQARQQERMQRRHHGQPPATAPSVPDQKP
jgi:Spy/CpxP family protein refolding chaperone